MTNQNGDLFIAAYRSHRAEMIEIRKRHWIFLLALAVAHSTYLLHGTIDLRYGPIDDQLILASYLIIAFIIHITLICGIYGFYSARSKLKQYNTALGASDDRLVEIVSADATMWTLRDLLFCGVSLLAPPVSVVIMFWSLPVILPVALYMVAIGICVKFRRAFLRVIFFAR